MRTCGITLIYINDSNNDSPLIVINGNDDGTGVNNKNIKVIEEYDNVDIKHIFN